MIDHLITDGVSKIYLSNNIARALWLQLANETHSIPYIDDDKCFKYRGVCIAKKNIPDSDAIVVKDNTEINVKINGEDVVTSV